MKKSVIIGVAATALMAVVAGMMLTSRPTEAQTEPIQATVAMITDGAGVDDQSYQELAWRGIKKYALETGLAEGVDGYQYSMPLRQTNPNKQFRMQLMMGLRQFLRWGIARLRPWTKRLKSILDVILL